MNLNNLLKLSRIAQERHKDTKFCEYPNTCGGCHWYSGYIAAIQDIKDDQKPYRLCVPKRKRKDA